MEKKKQELVIDAESTATGTFKIINYDELKDQVTEICTKYNSWKLTREDTEEAKDVKAKLNKVSKGFDDRRKELEKEYMKPFNVGKQQIKELCTMLNEAYTNINNQLNGFEEDDKAKRTLELLTELQPIFAESKITIDPIKYIKPTWLNKSTKQSVIIAEAQEIVNQLNDAYDFLKFVKPSCYVDEILFNFLNKFDVNNIVTTMKDCMNDNAKMHAYVKETSKMKKSDSMPTHEVRYIINGTKEELMNVSEILKEYGISYTVEKE